MTMRIRTVRMPVLAVDRHHHDMAVANAAFGDDVIGEGLHLAAAALQHRDLETGIVIDMDVQRRLREIVVLVKSLVSRFGNSRAAWS